MALLRLDRERGDRARVETLQADRLARLLAVAVGAVLDAGQRRVDLGDELALAVAGAQLERAVGLGGGAVGEVGVLGRILVQAGQRLLRLADDFFLPGQQLLAEVERGDARS